MVAVNRLVSSVFEVFPLRPSTLKKTFTGSDTDHALKRSIFHVRITDDLVKKIPTEIADGELVG